MKSISNAGRAIVGLSLIFLGLVALGPRPALGAEASIPVTGPRDLESDTRSAINRAQPEPDLPSLAEFSAAITGGRGGPVRGVYVPGELALRVLQQPGSSPAHVTSAPDAVSQFSLAAAHGAIGLLAHNHLAGQKFFGLRSGQTVVLILADGTHERYRIEKAVHYQALTPTSAVSDFLTLDGTGERISARELFVDMYTVPDQLVFQTCFEREGNPYWGRLFVVATPLVVAPDAELDVKYQRLFESGHFSGL